MKQQLERRLKIRVPGSTANLGPGFDALGLALSVYCTLTFDLLETNDSNVPLISLKGALTEGLSRERDNLIYTVLSNLWKNSPDLLERIRITIESEIPLGKGLGSSAAAITGAAWAAYALGGSTPDRQAVLSAAAAIEGHADNVSASLLGGLVVCARSIDSRKTITQKLAWPSEWCPVVVTPGHALSTKKARAALPRSISHADAVHNVQRVALLLAAVQNKDEEALREALHDRLHEPYRESLVPELRAVRRAISGMPALGCVLSGAGPSVLTIVHRRHRRQMLECLYDWASNQPESPQVLSLEVDQEGLRVNQE